MQEINGWRKRAAKIATEEVEHKVVVMWSEIFTQLQPIHGLAGAAVLEIDMAADAQLD